MSIQDKITALPEWLTPAFKPEPKRVGPMDLAQYWECQAEAALARLALARDEWVSRSHHRSCDAVVHYHAQCTCHGERDALLAALEPPHG